MANQSLTPDNELSRSARTVTIKTRNRTPFARWMWERGLTPKDLVGPLQRSFEAIRTYALDFGDPKRVIPAPATMDLIRSVTGGLITPAHFYEAASDRPADEDWTEGGRFLEVGEPV